MKLKSICFLLFCFVSMDLFCDSDTPIELYETGKVTSDKYLITLGEYQNTAISPNVFKSYGFYESRSVFFPTKYLGSFVVENISSVAFLNQARVDLDLTDISSLNYHVRSSVNLQYPLTIPIKLKKLELTVSPYIQFDSMIGFHPQIVNIMVQFFFGLNCGAKITGLYNFTDKIRMGADFSSFLVGMDIGRSGYNKDYMFDIVFSHYGNYIDLNLALFCEFDISDGSLGIMYSHGMNSYYGGTYSVISGEHQFGISYTFKELSRKKK